MGDEKDGNLFRSHFDHSPISSYSRPLKNWQVKCSRVVIDCRVKIVTYFPTCAISEAEGTELRKFYSYLLNVIIQTQYTTQPKYVDTMWCVCGCLWDCMWVIECGSTGIASFVVNVRNANVDKIFATRVRATHWILVAEVLGLCSHTA